MGSIDFKAFQLVNQFAGRWHLLDTLMKAVAKAGPLAFVLPFFYLWFKYGDDGKRAALLAIISVAVAMGVNQIIGHVYFRPRPFASHQVNLLFPKSPDPSFPSDHATFSFAIASLIWFFDRRVGGIAIALGLLIAISRVFVGLHYPIDVLSGAFIGSATGILVWRMRGKLDRLTLLATWHH
ncbi:MAG: undecaprenyl-diphosphatase [Chloroflexi bacterium]|nr:undecaprenyl-diphosphatase [Chloroflexota bacterium]